MDRLLSVKSASQLGASERGKLGNSSSLNETDDEESHHEEIEKVETKIVE